HGLFRRLELMAKLGSSIKAVIILAMSPANFVVMGSRQKLRLDAQFRRVSESICCAIVSRAGIALSGSAHTVSSRGTGVPIPLALKTLLPVVARYNRRGSLRK